ncbi:YheC/YheD family protein [Oceanobacillus sp. CFH 90083]|uniref:YheC/YheD family protein n=1 Tax=Oceanobacillus sp. CFH 90083 TaxID=2592336 RepID=UPI00128C4320|nr:YheC/YheD family protein [Oceanobacillus sp. CFH 90083]
MLIGYMHNYNKPTSLVKIISFVAKAKGINVVYFNSGDIDLNSDKITGSILVGDRWRKTEIKIPSIIDVNAFALKHEPEIAHLAKHAYLTDNGKNRSKEFIYTSLQKDQELRKHFSKERMYSKTNNGDPFDCRVHLEKDGQGKWRIAKNYIRIGLGEDAIANVKKGTGIAEEKVFFQANYPDKAEEINQKLKQLGLTFAKKVEKIRGIELATLGIDVDIDENENLFVSNISSAPAPSLLSAEIAMLRSDYYKFLFNNKR